MLAPFQRVEPEPEQLHGANQPAHRADDVLAALRADARLDRREIVEQRFGILVSARRVAERETEAPVDEGELAPVQLRLLTRPDRIAHVGQRRRVALDRCDQLRRDAAAHRILREPRLQRFDVVDVALQHETARLLVRAADRVGRHVRVPVAIAADPAAEAQEGRYRRADPRFDPLEEERRFIEERFAKARDQVADFVLYRRSGRVQLIGLPEQHDLRAQLRLERIVLVGGEHALVESAQQLGGRRELLAGRAAQYLGRAHRTSSA